MCGWQARLAPAEEESSACHFIYFRTAWHFKRGYSLQSHHSRVLRGPSLCYQNNPAVPHTPSTIVVPNELLSTVVCSVFPAYIVAVTL